MKRTSSKQSEHVLIDIEAFVRARRERNEAAADERRREQQRRAAAKLEAAARDRERQRTERRIGRNQLR
jgi:hypothetical protein